MEMNQAYHHIAFLDSSFLAPLDFVRRQAFSSAAGQCQLEQTMDQSSSPLSISSGPPAVSASASTQPTYTTAGTIYNPNSSQPLQPPTRRGRSFKWASGGALSEMGLFPRSNLAALPLKPSSGNLRGSTPNSHQQYTPLQQNYDRAISPISEPDHQAIRTPLQAPRLLPIPNMASVPSFPPLNSLRPLDDNDSDDDSDIGTDPLMNMTVKSLHNLASYPNPNQKRAQKALLRGAKPHLTSMTATSGLNASPGASHLPVFGSFESWKDVDDEAPGYLRHTASESSVLRRSEADNRSRLYGAGRPTRYSRHTDSHLSSPTPVNLSDEFNLSTSKILSSGQEAPKPLTAGPPGQRQYRPSTFESTFKALHPRFPSPSYALEDEETTTAANQRTLMHLTLTSEPLPPQTNLSPHQYLDLISRTPVQPAGYENDAGLSSDALQDEYLDVFETPAYRFAHSEILNQSDGDWPSKHGGRNLNQPFSTPASHDARAAGRLTNEEFINRKNRINFHWYAGIGIFGKPQTQAIADVDELPKVPKNMYGAVGDGRPIKRHRSDVTSDLNGSKNRANSKATAHSGSGSEDSNIFGENSRRGGLSRSTHTEYDQDPMYPLMLLGKALESIL